MTYRIECSFKANDMWIQGHIRRNIEANSPSEAIDKLMDLDTPDGKIKDCYKVWGIELWQKIESPKDRQVEADNPHKLTTCFGIPCPYKPYTKKYGASIIVCTRQNCPVRKANNAKSREENGHTD